MGIKRCKICDEFIYDFEVKAGKKHKCLPLWLCRISDGDDDKYTEEEKSEWFEYKSHAYSASTAAEQCAEEQEPNWDYSFINNGGVDIDVKDPKTGEVEKFFVSAEQVIEYHTSKRKE